MEKNNTDKTSLITELEKLEEQIKDQLAKATGYSLFHSFEIRKDKIHQSTRFWFWVLASLLVLTLVGGFYLVYSMSGQNLSQLGVAFYLKLSLSLPFLFAISFSTRQYSRERRLEEEYAFKSNISISLTAYKDLVEKLVNTDDIEQKREYTQFIINTINNVFTSPTDGIFKEKESKDGLDEKAIKLFDRLAEISSKFKSNNS